MTYTRDNQNDPYQWLEEIQSERSLGWVKKENRKSESKLTQSQTYTTIYESTLKRLDSDKKVTTPHFIHEDKIYNFWTDKENRRGILRRCSYQQMTANQSNWETVIDIDQLGKKEGKSWVYKGIARSNLLPDRFLVYLSDGGKDASEIREFDLTTLKFIETGFYLPESKSNITWINRDEVWVGTAISPAERTDSGYPRIIKRLKRNNCIEEATTIFEANQTDMSVSAQVLEDDGHQHLIISQTHDFYTGTWLLYENNRLINLNLPKSVILQGIYQGQIIVRLRSKLEMDQQTFNQGSLVGFELNQLKNNNLKPVLIFEPSNSAAIEQVAICKNQIVINLTENVQSRLLKLKLDGNSDWAASQINNTPKLGNINLYGICKYRNDFWYTYESFLQPTNLYYVSDATDHIAIQSMPEDFDASQLTVEQLWAESQDGTKIPYFVLRSKNIAYNSLNPTIIYGYGGFEVSLTPSYSVSRGKWLELGGVFIIANIRGGGEFGPAWHQAALKQNRTKAFEDFAAVAKALIENKTSSVDHIGIMGGSNGGLLVGASMVLYPTLYKAIVCQVPLLDMKRYHKLLAGASWMAEYGNPDNHEEWEFIRKYSPYQNVKKTTAYPSTLFTTSTLDDRVHPGHARKMAAKMLSYDHDVLYFENFEGGHGAGTESSQIAHVTAMEYSFLFEKLGN